MRLIDARVVGFQSFADTGVVAFGEGINLIVGQNNAGKSALLRALQPDLADDRHRTPLASEEARLPKPTVHLSIEISGSELTGAAFLRGGQLVIPTPYEVDARTYAKELLQKTEIIFRVNNRPGEWFAAEYPSHSRFKQDINLQSTQSIVQPVDGELTFGVSYGQNETTPLYVHDVWRSRMFYFSAERLTVGQGEAQNVSRLVPNASNLPAVLNTLSSERGDLFRKLVGHLAEIFPTVGNLSTRLIPNAPSILEIRVWPTARQERVDLSFPLDKSGTGVAQMIALLTAVMTVERAVVIIDEINSFLHPAAVKALLRILQTEYAQHQYIISTHAPEVVGFGNPRSIHLVKRSGYESTVERLDLANVAELREVADHLGVSMADVFAADRIIWVEGPTEEVVFPYLYQRMEGRPLPPGTIFTSVASTGDLTRKRDRAIVYEVYSRLSAAAAKLVVAVAFSFDTERLSADEKRAMVRDSGDRLRFLPRRHLECYLLEPEAIAALIRSKDAGSAVTGGDVATKVGELGGDDAFRVPEWKGDIAEEAWLAAVDAARLIARCCAELSDHRAAFGKKEDSLALLKAILDRDPAKLTPLHDHVRCLVGAVSQAGRA